MEAGPRFASLTSTRDVGAAGQVSTPISKLADSFPSSQLSEFSRGSDDNNYGNSEFRVNYSPNNMRPMETKKTSTIPPS